MTLQTTVGYFMDFSIIFLVFILIVYMFSSDSKFELPDKYIKSLLASGLGIYLFSTGLLGIISIVYYISLIVKTLDFSYASNIGILILIWIPMFAFSVFSSVAYLRFYRDHQD